MGLRRCSLLMLGISGGLLFATMLLISIYSTYKFGDAAVITGTPELTTPYIPPQITTQDALAVSGQTIALPVAITGTKLIAQQMTAYDGLFLEDGSGQEVVGIAALVVYNAGDQEVLQAGITLQQKGDAEATLCFYGENIPPGKAVLLLERNRRSYSQEPFASCSGWQVSALENREPSTYLEITEKAMDTVVVTNITAETLQSICLYYKSWLSPPDIYIGGISYAIWIPSLQPGESVVLHPPYYAGGYTKIVSVSVSNP